MCNGHLPYPWEWHWREGRGGWEAGHKGGGLVEQNASEERGGFEGCFTFTSWLIKA